MAGKQESFPMTGGDGPYSYAKNSKIQRQGAEVAKAMLLDAIAENLEIPDSISNSNSFSIADLGCSVGPNTFITMKNIIETIQQKYKAIGNTNLHHPLEFQIFFNDHISNDFNTLFSGLPPDRQYYGAGVPGSFHGRLFPKASLNLFYSAYALHWLSRVPIELSDLNSTSCNKGRIYYLNAPKAVGDAYSAQYAKDMKIFLSARAQELAPGGLMAILIPGRLRGTLPSDSSLGPFFLPFESSLIDMANEGIICEDKLDLFNLPMYSPSTEEIEELILENGCFSIARMEESQPKSIPYATKQECRAGLQEIVKAHFGTEILDELFDRYAKKIEGQTPENILDGVGVGFFILLKRK